MKANYKIWRKIEEAREFVRSLGLKNREKWLEYVKENILPEGIPRYPNREYKNKGWISYGDF
jgi:hypothetical protein